MDIETIDILLVEDNLGDAELLEEFLQDTGLLGIQLTHARDLHEAVHLLQGVKRAKFDAVLLDLQLPDSQGLDTLRLMQKQNSTVPYIVLTGFHNEDLAIAAVREGAQDYLVKGQIHGNLLLKAIRYAIERKRSEEILRQQADRERLMGAIAQHVRHSLELPEILNTTVSEVYQFFQIDRVLIGRFEPDWSLKIIVESVQRDWCSLLGQHLPEAFFADDYYRESYQQGCVQAINDVYTAKLPEEQGALLRQMQAQSNLVVPISEGDVLWGLLVAQHCRKPRHWQTWEIDFLRQLSIHLGIALQQSELYQQVQNELLERKRAEEALRLSENRLNSILRSLKDVVWSQAVPHFELLYLNPAAEVIYGRPISEFFDQPELWLQVVHPDDREKIFTQRQLLLQWGHEEFEYRIMRPDGEVRWLYRRSQVAYDSDQRPSRIDGIETDITDRKRMEEQLLHEACHDALTGLPNRTLFMDRLQQAMVRSQRYPFYHFAVLFLDLDRFKVVNDSLGHLVGDQLLVAIARRLSACLRPTDTIARFGGDEFTILLDHIHSIHDAVQVAERIHQMLEAPFKLNNYEIFSSTSIGIVPVTPEFEYPEDVLRHADAVMYHAKSQGRGCHALFDAAMHSSALNLLQLETDLRRAIERQEIRVDYQPIVLLNTGEITGFEALIRWQHPQRGRVAPLEFVPIAEETGLIVPIGWWVLQEACQQLAQWQCQFSSKKSLTMSVNLSTKQFNQPDLVNQVERILTSNHLHSHSLNLEITEGELMGSDEIISSILTRLKTLEVQLSIDDFGTGYSSLSRLHQFPIDTLKIDRSFITEMIHNGGKAEIPKTIITLAHNLGMNVVAEGIETPEQFCKLQRLECDYGQGYWFSPPLSPLQATELLASQPTYRVA